MDAEQKHLIKAQHLESDWLDQTNFDQTNKEVFQRLTDLVDDLKAVEEHERTLIADENPDPPLLTRPAATAS